MLTIIKVIFCVLYVTLAEELYDVTTVYHIGNNYINTKEETSVEVHLRTNARGLPIFYKGKVVDDSIIGRVFPAFDGNMNNKNNNSLWQTKDWTLKPEFDESLFYKDDLTANSITLGRKTSQIQPLPRIISAKLDGYLGTEYGSGYRLQLFIFSHETELIASQPDYYTIIFSYYYKTGYLMHCSPEDRTNHIYFKDTDGNDRYKYCTGITSFQTDNWIYDTRDATNSFVLDVSNGGVQLWSDLLQRNKVLDWKPSQEYPPIRPKYFSMYYRQGESYNLKASFSTNAVLESNSSNSSPLISPWFTADLDHLCLAVVAKGFISFNVKAENAEGSRFKLDFEEVNLYKINYTVLHLTSPVPEQLKRSNIRLVLTPTSVAFMTIQRISSCNSQEEGDVAILNPEEFKDKPQIQQQEYVRPEEFVRDDDDIDGLFTTEKVQTNEEVIFDVYSDNGFTDKKWCSRFEQRFSFNGGCKRDHHLLPFTFACPPGFAGYNCETACGRNSFGLDCGGVCSVYTDECKGIRLCTPAMGCHCAPGYYGKRCEEQCELGKYGSDCDQTCGHCAEPNNCDIYTGHCVTCQPGYFPPYCKDTYPVVKRAPNVSTPSFGQADVTPILNDYSGRGVPTMYQIQYRESKPSINNWIIQDTFDYTDISKADNNLNSSDIASTTIYGLNYGKFYEVRVLLFDENLNNYEKETVPITKFLSLCTIPDKMDYHIIPTLNTTSTSFTWDYKNTTVYWCPVQHYQVAWKENWKWVTENTTDTSFTLTNLLSGREIQFKVRAFTSGGFAPYSKRTFVSTTLKVPGPVRYLSSQHIGNSELISWYPPAKFTSEKMDYQIKYQCLRRLGCRTECDPSDSLEVQTSNTNTTLYSLMPFTQYLITVSAGKGPGTSIVIGTTTSVPTETVKASNLSPVRTNNSVTVFWEPVEVCSGFIKGYIYQLYKADDAKIVKTGFTKETHVTIDGLSAKTDYVARIFIENIAGWDADKYLVTNISTSATVPEKVENLTVYKRGRNLLGLRWEQPRKIYGVLKSFTIHYGYRSNNNTIVVAPTPCIVWPDLYCHVLDNLSPNQKYTVTVAAKNAEVVEDGVSSSVTEVTKEGTAGLPESVEVVNATSSSFALAWKYPSMANGIIRSFLLSVEETERFESDKCCEIYPLVETTVKEELVNYSVEVAGLHPASTYTVSLSAKTVSFGPSKTLTIYTRPPQLPVQYLPEIDILRQEKWSWLPQNLLENLNNSEIYQPLIKGSILLVILDSRNEGFQSGIEHEQLLAELTKLIKTDFYFVGENQKGVPTITTEDSVQSVWGTTSIPQLNVGETYRYATVQISEYCSVYNIDVVFSSTFTAV